MTDLDFTKITSTQTNKGFVLATCLILILMISALNASLIASVDKQIIFHQEQQGLSPAQHFSVLARQQITQTLTAMVTNGDNLTLDKPGYIGRWQPLTAQQVRWHEQAVALNNHDPIRYLIIYLGDKATSTTPNRGELQHLFKGFIYYHPSGDVGSARLSTEFFVIKGAVHE
ncbi:hypothetical protein [Thalassotalea maritima]|uniref:hypothetical protein n=1 Tax=Thalassotalea maritima TaxID=3242416 RepID=UPI003528C125